MMMALTGPAHANDCKSLSGELFQLTREIKAYNQLLRKNYESRYRFTRDMYQEVSVNEGRSLYIPYGTYDSYYRSIAKEHANMVDVRDTTNRFDSQLDLISNRLKECL
jgi:hypothetical protein